MVNLFSKKNEHGGVEIYSKMPFLEKPVADVWKDQNIDSNGYQDYLVNLFLNSSQMFISLTRIYSYLQRNRHDDFIQDCAIDLLDIFDEELSPEFIINLNKHIEFMSKNEQFKK